MLWKELAHSGCVARGIQLGSDVWNLIFQSEFQCGFQVGHKAVLIEVLDLLLSSSSVRIHSCTRSENLAVPCLRAKPGQPAVRIPRG